MIRTLKVFCLLLSATACWTRNTGLQDGKKVALSVCGHATDLELAVSESARSKGYMDRDKGPVDNEGILFLFEDEELRSFWMANVKFPLDILFINSLGDVVSMTTMQTESQVPKAHLKLHSSKLPARAAIEFRSGWIAEKKVQVGCRVKLDSIIPPLKD